MLLLFLVLLLHLPAPGIPACSSVRPPGGGGQSDAEGHFPVGKEADEDMIKMMEIMETSRDLPDIPDAGKATSGLELTEESGPVSLYAYIIAQWVILGVNPIHSPLHSMGCIF